MRYGEGGEHLLVSLHGQAAHARVPYVGDSQLDGPLRQPEGGAQSGHLRKGLCGDAAGHAEGMELQCVRGRVFREDTDAKGVHVIEAPRVQPLVVGVHRLCMCDYNSFIRPPQLQTMVDREDDPRRRVIECHAGLALNDERVEGGDFLPGKLTTDPGCMHEGVKVGEPEELAKQPNVLDQKGGIGIGRV